MVIAEDTINMAKKQTPPPEHILGRAVTDGAYFTAWQGVHNNWRVFMTGGGPAVEVTETMLGAFPTFDHVHGRPGDYDTPLETRAVLRELRKGGPVYIDLGTASDPGFSLARWLEAIATETDGKPPREVKLVCIYT